MIEKAFRFLRESLINPSDRVVEFSDQDDQDRIFIIDDKGQASEVKPSFDFIADEPLVINTLTGFVNYVLEGYDRLDASLIVHVKDEKTVHLTSGLFPNGERELVVEANAIVPRFHYDRFLDMEELNISLQSKFTQTEDRDILLKVIGNIKEENVRATGDDGTSQAVTIKQGVASVADVKVPNPVRLAPYRTFLEVDQPSSDFIFRMKDGPRGAIFEADGGAWRNQAIVNVRDYLEKELEEEIANGRITLIA